LPGCATKGAFAVIWLQRSEQFCILLPKKYMTDRDFMEQAIRLAQEGMDAGTGGPFGAVVVRQGQVIGQGQNRVLADGDPTAHAEIVAIREACAHLGHFQLEDCTLYTSCEPCPMCLGAIYWARPARLVYACGREDASAIGFDDRFIYDEMGKQQSDRRIPTRQLLRGKAWQVMQAWIEKTDKIQY